MQMIDLLDKIRTAIHCHPIPPQLSSIMIYHSYIQNSLNSVLRFWVLMRKILAILAAFIVGGIGIASVSGSQEAETAMALN